MQRQRCDVVMGAKVIEENAVGVCRVTVGMDELDQLLGHGCAAGMRLGEEGGFYARGRWLCLVGLEIAFGIPVTKVREWNLSIYHPTSSEEQS